MLKEIIDSGKQIYNLKNSREKRRFVIYCCRSVFQWNKLKNLYDFFAQDELRNAIIEKNKYPLEQATRSFFYAGASFSERCKPQ